MREHLERIVEGLPRTTRMYDLGRRNLCEEQDYPEASLPDEDHPDTEGTAVSARASPDRGAGGEAPSARRPKSR